MPYSVRVCACVSCCVWLLLRKLKKKKQARKEVWGGPGWTVDGSGSGSCGGKTPRGSPNGGANDASAPAAASDEVSLGRVRQDCDRMRGFSYSR